MPAIPLSLKNCLATLRSEALASPDCILSNRVIATATDLDGDGASAEDADDIVTNKFYDLSGNVIITILLFFIFSLKNL